MAVHFAIFAVLSERTHRDGRTDRRCRRHCGDTATPASPFRDNESLHFLDWSFAETKDWDQTAQLWSETGVEFNQAPQPVIVDVIGNASLISSYFFVYFWISKKVKRFLPIKTYLVHVKSTGELISLLALNSAIAQSEVWSQQNDQLIAESKRKNDFTFWLILVSVRI